MAIVVMKKLAIWITNLIVPVEFIYWYYKLVNLREGLLYLILWIETITYFGFS
jgi:hypothetical protein